jgi:hypothetical protein
MFEVNRHGLHEYQDIQYLVQSADVQNAVGLLDSPDVSFTKSVTCPHKIKLNDAEPDEDFLVKVNETDPLVQFLTPTPKVSPYIPYLVEDFKTMEALYYLVQLGSPIEPAVMPIWNINKSKVRNDLYKSNLATIVVTDIGKRNRDFKDMMELANSAFYAPGKLLFLGDSTVPVKETVKPMRTRQKFTNVLRSEINWRRYGASKLREYMRECH